MSCLTSWGRSGSGWHGQAVISVRVEEGIAVPVPSVKKLDLAAVGLGPDIAVSKRSIEVEDADSCQDE
jgi:hypothetical protein